MSVIADKISSDSRNFLAGVKSSTAKNDRTLNSAMNLSMRLDGKEVELSDKRRKINAESFEEQPQQMVDNFNEGYISGYQFGTADGIAKGIELGKDSIINPLDELFKALPVAAVTILAGIPQLTGLLDIFLPDRDKSVDSDVNNDGGVSPTSAADQSGGLGSPDLPYKANDDGSVEPVKMSEGGRVPGFGNKDTVPAMLTPGEFVMSKDAVNKYGTNTLAAMNSMGGGTDISSLMGGADSNTQLVVMRQPIIVTKKEMGTVVNNGSQLAVIVSGDQRRSDFINFAQRIT